MGVTMFRLSEVTVFPHSANEVLSKLAHAHAAKDTDIQTVLPERTAPSQIIASQFLCGLDGHHQLRTSSCFLEKLSKVRFEGLLTVLTVRVKCTGTLFKCAQKIRAALVLHSRAYFTKFVQCFQTVKKLDFKSAAFWTFDV